MKAINDMFQRGIKMADGKREDYIENFVKEVMTIYERILMCALIGHIIVEPEKRDGQKSLWHNIGKLAVFASSTADLEERSGSWAHWMTII